MSLTEYDRHVLDDFHKDIDKLRIQYTKDFIDRLTETAKLNVNLREYLINDLITKINNVSPKECLGFLYLLDSIIRYADVSYRECVQPRIVILMSSCYYGNPVIRPKLEKLLNIWLAESIFPTNIFLSICDNIFRQCHIQVKLSFPSQNQLVNLPPPTIVSTVSTSENIIPRSLPRFSPGHSYPSQYNNINNNNDNMVGYDNINSISQSQNPYIQNNTNNNIPPNNYLPPNIDNGRYRYDTISNESNSVPSSIQQPIPDDTQSEKSVIPSKINKALFEEEVPRTLLQHVEYIYKVLQYNIKNNKFDESAESHDDVIRAGELTPEQLEILLNIPKNPECKDRYDFSHINDDVSYAVINRYKNPPGNKCSNCGARLLEDEIDDHYMDHMKINKEHKEMKTYRGWYSTKEEWIEQKNINNNQQEKQDELKEQEHIVIQDLLHSTCETCGEPFLTEFRDDIEGGKWVYLNAIRSEEDGLIYHYDCYMQEKKEEEEEENDTISNTKENSMNINSKNTISNSSNNIYDNNKNKDIDIEMNNQYDFINNHDFDQNDFQF
ncbi:hypothetical protein WA158_004738 [Blastocystis sp. Blastoise]